MVSWRGCVGGNYGVVDLRKRFQNVEGTDDGGVAAGSADSAPTDGPQRPPSHSHSGSHSNAAEDSNSEGQRTSSHPRSHSSVTGQAPALTSTQEMDVLHYREPLLDDN